jgi:hypothetical protein
MDLLRRIWFSNKYDFNRRDGALVARELAFDYLKSADDLGEWVRKHDRLLEDAMAHMFPKASISRAESALILKQSVYFAIEREEALRRHLGVLEAYRKAAEIGALINIGEELVEYMRDIPYLAEFRV